MCVVVRVDPAVKAPAAELDLDDLAIYLSDQLTAAQALILTRRLMARVGIEQPDIGAACWCGDPVAMPSSAIP